MRIGIPGAALATALLAGCVQPMPPHANRVIYEDRIVEVPEPLPADRYEVVPPPPSERLVWVKGHWKWEGFEWVWQPGHYIEKPHPEAFWKPGHYVQKSWGLVWIPGHWS